MISIKIIREPNDIITNRISAGGDINDGILYLVFRGQPKDIRKIIKEISESLEMCKDNFDKMPSGEKYLYPAMLGKN